jgi:hypothetical protein
MLLLLLFFYLGIPTFYLTLKIDACQHSNASDNPHYKMNNEKIFKELMSELHYFMATPTWATFRLTKYRSRFAASAKLKEFQNNVRQPLYLNWTCGGCMNTGYCTCSLQLLTPT